LNNRRDAEEISLFSSAFLLFYGFKLVSMLPSPEEQPEALDQAVDEALEGAPRAEQWQTYVDALERRRELLQRDMGLIEDPHDRELVEKQVDELDVQIQVLREEESITRFVEDAVTFSYEVRRLSEG
jgi:hypothetical protein